MTKLAVFRCDATVATGIGHLMRCHALASRLEWLGWECRFAVSRSAIDLTRRQLPDRKIFDVGLDLADEPGAMAQALPGGCDLLVVDNYRWDARLETGCRPSARQILAIDDLADRMHDCDFLLDQTFGRRRDDYSALAPGAKYLLGSQFALLRDEFRRARPAAIERRKKNGYRLQKLLLGFGGTDPAGMTLAALDVLADAKSEVVVMGSHANPRLDDIRASIARRKGKASLHIDCSDVAALMSECDLAVGAGGGSAWERCAVALPTLLFVIAENQRHVASALAGAGAVRLVDDVAKLSGAVAALDDPDALAALSERAAALCDGLGTVRVAAALVGNEIDGRGRTCWLEAAGVDHMDAVFAWQTAPGNRRFARSGGAPSRSEHMSWFRNCLADPQRLLFVVVVEGRAVGTLRLDQLDGGAREVSILIDPASHGAGVGKAALRLARRVAPGCRLVAEILPGNAASLRIFEDCGYRPAGGNRFVHEPQRIGHEVHYH